MTFFEDEAKPVNLKPPIAYDSVTSLANFMVSSSVSNESFRLSA